ncbi:MAG: TetR/AcrR family transcriptional regulator [Kofleriaceae bacterium]|nr:TetR/AcrR family transcriptional regulator [Kofleriaceae bacterium]
MPTRTAYHHGNLKPALISAALKELAHEGLEGFSLRGVARRAGVSAPAVYRHFEDKEALLVAVASESAERLGAAMVEAVARAPDDPLEKFRATGIAIVKFAVANPEHFRALAIPDLDKRTPPAQRELARAWNEEQRRQLLAAQAKGQIAAIPIDDLILAASSTVMGLAHLIIGGSLGKIDEASAVRLASNVTEVLGIGLIPREPAGRRTRTTR